MNEEEVLDTTGQICPMPLIRAKISLEKIKKGNILEILGDHKESVTDIVTTVKNMNAQILKFEHDKDSQAWRLLIKR